MTGSVSESLIQSGTRCFSFISIPFRLLVLSSSHRSMMRSEHAVLLFTRMTANLTFNCQSAAYMIFCCHSFLVLSLFFLSISKMSCLSFLGASLFLSSSLSLSLNHLVFALMRAICFNYASSFASFLPLLPFALTLLTSFHFSLLFHIIQSLQDLKCIFLYDLKTALFSSTVC